MNRIKVTEVDRHLYEVKLNCGYKDWEILRIKAINEYVAVFKAMRGRWIRMFIIR